MDPEQASGRHVYRWWLIPVLVLVGGIALTAIIAPRTLVPVRALITEVTEARHDRLHDILAQRLADSLDSARDLTARHPQAFSTQANAFLDTYPEIRGLELLTRVSHSQRPMVERQLSEQSGQFIRFANWIGSFDSQVAEPADHYLIIRQALPAEDIGAASLGLEATSVPHWRDAILKAREDNRVTATTVTRVHRNGDEQRAMRLFVPLGQQGEGAADTGRLIALVIDPQQWLEQLLVGAHDPRWQLEIHDISQYARRPLASLQSSGIPAGAEATTRSTLTVGSRQWMLSTSPSRAWMDNLEHQALWPAWITGLAVTLLATALTAWAIWLMLRTNRLLAHRTRRARHLGQQLDNTRLEKNILHHSLQESDRRTRDLIELGAGIFAELDEGRHVGYISPQAATLLDIPSTELLGKALDILFPEDCQMDLTMAFDAARRDQSLQRLDTRVTTRNGNPLPVALRIKALKDPLSGCSGYRVSLMPRQ
ncbi:CHASE domain-containing protein [Marinobacter sp. M1N3S26]|uniref:CHASE domain-containing protein n=1 Tax=unclassified Marinobacter TaxID=83889 RepID=UPI00387B9C66